MKYKEKIQEFSLELLSGTNTFEVFQNWLQENIGNLSQAELDFALPLIEVDLQSNRSRPQFINSLREQYKKLFDSDLEQDRAKYLLKQIVQGRGDVVAWCHELSKLLAEEIEFLPIEFKGFSSELDDIPLERDANKWNKSAFEEKRKKINAYEKSIKELAAKTLSRIKS
ncbi:hypothetical protein EBS43_11120 [bacterium]|nr:hypothetical protein [bacterium]